LFGLFYTFLLLLILPFIFIHKMQYLGKDILLKSIEFKDISTDHLISADTYNESKILENFKNHDIEVQKLLLKCSIHIAIIGSGNKTYGAIRDDNNIVHNIKDIFDKHKIFYNRNTGEKYDDNSLSARRLLRLFRYQIQEFILKEKRPSYLWSKYSTRDINTIEICFPGAEHLITEKEDALYLLDCYIKIDNLMNTSFVVRLCRVFIARGVLLPLEVIQLKK